MEAFLQKIYQQEVSKITFNAYDNLNQSYAFIYFIDGLEPLVTEALVSLDHTNTRPAIKRDKINYVVIHDTGNNDKTATALAHMNYITSSNVNRSWHYTVEENIIYQHIPDNEVAYHAGDGIRDIGDVWYSTTYQKQNYGGGNLKGIGIETCVNSGSDYLRTLKSTASLSAHLLNKYDLTINELKTHYDFSGKKCPYLLIEDNYFGLLKTWTSLYLEAINLFKDIKVSYIPITNTLDEDGLISSDTEKIIKYQVKLEYLNDIYLYDFETVLK